MFRFFCFVLIIWHAVSMAEPVDTQNRKLKIAILRHITVEEAELLSIDSQAERMLITEAKSRGHEIQFLDPRQLICSTSSHPSYDVVISRAEIDSFDSHLTDSYLRALDFFETLNIPVINSSLSTITAQDKFRTLLLAHKAGISIPKTFLVYDFEHVKKLLEQDQIQYPFFIKKPYGGCGKSVYKVENARALSMLVKNFQDSEPILVQESIDLETDEQGNVRDMRIWVVRDATTKKAKFVGGSYRTAARGHYLTNTSAGGVVTPLEEPYDPKIAKMAEQALEAIEGDVAGIDIARDKKGNLYLIEVNISFYTGKVFQNVIGINPWKLVLDLVEARANKKAN